MVIWRLPILQKSVRYRRVVSCAHSKGRLVFPSGATCSISESKSQSPSCCTRTTHYQQSRWKSDSLTSQLSIEASVSLLELRQDGGEEQTHRCRRRSTSPRLKRSKGPHSRFPPIKAQQKRQTAALSIKTRIETSKTMERRSRYKGVLESYAAHAPISERSSTSLPRSEHNELAEHIDKQGACPSSVRHVVQQARLCGSREIVV